MKLRRANHDWLRELDEHVEKLIRGDLALADNALAQRIEDSLARMESPGLLGSGREAAAVVSAYVEDLRPRANIVRTAFAKAAEVLPPLTVEREQAIEAAAGRRIDTEFDRLRDGLTRRLRAHRTGGVEHGFPAHFGDQREWAIGELDIDLRRLRAPDERQARKAGPVAAAIDRIKRHRLIAIVLLAVALLIGVGSIIDASEKIRGLFSPRTPSSAISELALDANIPTPDTGRVSVRVNGFHGLVTIAPGESYFYSWTSAGQTACQQTEPRPAGGASVSGQSTSILPAHPFYPSNAKPTVLKMVCTDGTTNSIDSAVVRLATRSRPSAVEDELRRLGYALGDDARAAEEIIGAVERIRPRITGIEDSVRASILVFDAHRLRQDIPAACQELQSIAKRTANTIYARGVEVRLINYCAR